MVAPGVAFGLGDGGDALIEEAGRAGGRWRSKGWPGGVTMRRGWGEAVSSSTGASTMSETRRRLTE